MPARAKLQKITVGKRSASKLPKSTKLCSVCHCPVSTEAEDCQPWKIAAHKHAPAFRPSPTKPTVVATTNHAILLKLFTARPTP